jgi:protein-S-isoprenylcysteine O-methyltransferase Ste14
VTSPLWYRARGTIFAFIFLIGFIVPASLGAALHAPYVPAFAALGASWGSTGVNAAMAIAIALMIVCYGLRVWGSSYLNARTVWDLDARTDALVTDGPFRYTRNPLYLGNVLMAFGFGALAPLWGWAFIVIACTAYVVALIRWEEFAMRLHYGKSFERYAQSVPVLIPRISPAPAQATVRPSLRQGILAEVFSASLFIGMMAVLFSAAFGWWIFLACFLAGGFVQRRLARI